MNERGKAARRADELAGDAMPNDAAPLPTAHPLGRRTLLAGGLSGLLCLALPEAARAARRKARRIRLRCAHTGDCFEGVYWRNGRYDADAMRRIDWVLRDFHRGAVRRIDPALIDVLAALAARLRTRHPFLVLSGYRTPQTNAMLRREGYRTAAHSMHILGKAVDIHPEGLHLATLRRAAERLRAGGVGFYPRDGFVHLDTGPLRRWRCPERRHHRSKAVA